MSFPTTRPNAPKKRAVLLANEIEREIKVLGWPVGHNLGSEPELLERHAVGRSVFREAVRLLEHLNVAEMRKGPGGGLVVVEPDEEGVVKAASLFLEYRNVGPEGLFETRKALELTAVRLATARLDEGGITQLRAAVEHESSVLARDEFGRAEFPNFDLHELIAELSGDPALHLFLVVSNRLAAPLLQVDSPDGRYRPFAASVHGAHSRIVDAMISGDSALARHYMLRHLDAVAEYSVNGGRAEHEPAGHGLSC